MKNPIAVPILAVLLCASLYKPAQGSTLYLDTPDLCSKVQKVEQGRVYLTTNRQCPQLRGKVPVAMEAGDVEVYVNGQIWEVQRPVEFSLGVPGEAMQRAQALAGSITVPENAYAKEAATKAKDMTALFQSEGFQQKLNKESARIRRDVFGQKDAVADYYKNLNKTGGKNGPVLSGNERVYVFVSSSIPLETLKSYAKSIDAVGDPNIYMVVRGFIGGMSEGFPTLNFINSFRGKVPVVIDPYLFRRYGITQVPAVVFVQNVQMDDPDASEGLLDRTTVGSSYTFLGDVPLGYALQKISQVSMSPHVLVAAEKLQ